MKPSRLATCVCACAVIAAAPAAAATVTLSAGGNLQQAIDNAAPGDTIALAPGATFTGNFTLTAKGGAAFITIRTAGDDGLPTDGVRVSRPTRRVWRRFGSPEARPRSRPRPALTTGAWRYSRFRGAAAAIS